MDNGLGAILSEFGVCVLVLVLTCWIVAGFVLQRSAPKWRGFLIVGSSALLFSLGSYVLLSRLLAARATTRQCCLALVPYGLGVYTTLLAAMSIAVAACAAAVWIAWLRRWWALVPILVLGMVLPPPVVVGYAAGPIQPLVGSGYNVERVVIGQALLVLLFGIGLWYRGRPSTPGQRPHASMARDDHTD